MMKIDLEILKFALNSSIDGFIMVNGTTKIEISSDFYWSILDKQIFDMSSHPSEFEVGSIFEEYDEILRNIERGDHLSSPAMQAIAALLTAISTQRRGDGAGL